MVPDLQMPIAATAALCAGPILFVRSFQQLRTRQLIQNTPTSHIRSMAMGLVEVQGTIAMPSSTAAPFSGRPCAFWAVDIAVQSRRRGGWTIVHRNSSGQPFYLRDETGVALVYPRGADCRVRFGSEDVCPGLTVPECYARYMSEQQLALRHLWRIGAMRFRERVLEEGDRVYLLGTAEPKGVAATISAGEFTGAEAEALGPLRAEARPGTSSATPRDRQRALRAEAVAVIRRGAHQPTFIISQDSERTLAFGLGIHAITKMVAGPALTLFGLAFWLHTLSSRNALP